MAMLVCPSCKTSMRSATEVVVGTVTCPNCKHRWAPTAQSTSASDSTPDTPKLQFPVAEAIPVAKKASRPGVAKAVRNPPKSTSRSKKRDSDSEDDDEPIDRGNRSARTGRTKNQKMIAYILPGVVVLLLLVGTTLALTFWSKQRSPMSATEVYAQTLKSTVFIITKNGIGSGVLIQTSPPKVLSNYHVVKQEDRVIVMFPLRQPDGNVITELQQYLMNKANGISGKVVQTDPTLDLALIELESIPSDAKAIELCENQVKVGQSVYSIGCSGIDENVQNSSLWRLTTGTVRARGIHNAANPQGAIRAMILETQSPTNPGDSGGPVVDEYGQLVAIVCGYRPAEQIVAWNIDQEEIRKFLGHKPLAADPAEVVKPNIIASEPVEADKPGETKPAVNALIAQLNDKNERKHAVETLASLGIDGQPAIVPLLQTLDGKDAAYERLCEQALRQFGRVNYLPSKTINSAMSSSSPLATKYVLDWIAQQQRPSSEFLPPIKNLLNHPDPGVREKALFACAAIGTGAKDLIFTQVIQALGDDDPMVRRAATKTLEPFKPFTRNDLPKLAPSMKSSNVEVRLFALQSILGIVDSAENVEKYVMPFLHDSSTEILTAAIKGLMNWAVVANRNMIDILPLLTHESRAIRADALELLGAMPKSATSTNALTRMMRYDADDKLREAACLKLESQVKNDPVDVKIISDIMMYGSKKVRKSCLEKIAKIGPDALSLLPQLTGDLRDPDYAIRNAAMNAIIALKTNSQTVMDIYIEIVSNEVKNKDDKDAVEYRMAAAKALAKMGQKGLEELVRIVKKSEEPELFTFVNVELRASKWRPESTVAWLLKLVTEKPQFRKEAATTLAAIADSETVSGLLIRTEFIPFDGPQDGPNNPSEIRSLAIQILGDMDWQKLDKEDREKIISRLKFMAAKERDGRNMKLAKEVLNKHRITAVP